MIGYSDIPNTLHTPGTPRRSPSPITEKRPPIQLTPLWEHVVRTQSVPKDVNLDDIFMALNDRLRDPEWEVRQHALRVLVDVIPVMDDTLDDKMEILLGDLVGNLGHPGPAVRKGALDSLKVYLNHSSHREDILRNIVYRGVENYSENQLQNDVVVGIILSLPSLIFPGVTSDNTIDYVVKSLVNKLVQITFQEVSLRSLVRIREIISPEKFNWILDQSQSRHDFELLCQVYDQYNFENKNDLNANIIDDNRWSDSDVKADDENNVPSGKVILETEIQFNSSTAVTMKILEEGANKNESDSDDDSRDCVVKVLSDSDSESKETFELRRRTPRRVRFGGEIVKLRTPDSDSNHQSDIDDITITTSSDPNNPVIEIKFITDEKRNKKHKSLIPVPIVPTTQKPKARSLPNSPSRKVEPKNKTKLLYQSHPNLTRTHFFNKPKNTNKNKLKVQIPKRPTFVSRSPSPILPHKSIELFHNLTRSPSTPEPEPIFQKPQELQQNKEEKIAKGSSIESKASDPSVIDFSDNESTPGRTFSSFILKDSGSDGIQSDSCIPNIDNGDCLTCSSSGSEGTHLEPIWEAAGVIPKSIIDDMHNKDDLRTKLNGFESFEAELKKPETLKKMQPYLGPLLHFLFNAERHPRLQNTVEEILKNVLKNSQTDRLKLCLPQIAMYLSKMGSPSSIRLGIVVMQNLSARMLVQHLLEEPLMSARSAKTREGAMQLLVCATTTFPSTEFDISLMAEKVALGATDRKRRVRQVTLDVLAVLAQLGQPSVVVEAVSKAAKDLPDRDGLLAAVRARLSRRQLPIVEPNGTIINASPGVGQGADIEWVAAGSGSISPCSARSRRRAMTPVTSNNSASNRMESAVVPHRNMWSARKFQNTTNSDQNGNIQEGDENVTWALVPYNKKDEQQNKTAQLWTIEQQGNGGERYNGNGSLRPIYLLQPQHPPPTLRRLKQIEHPQTDQKRPYSRGRSSSPPLRLANIRGVTRNTRGQSSSPPEYMNRRIQGVRRPFATDSDSSQSIRSSPPRTNWQRDFQSAIPVPVTGEISRSRFRRRLRDEDLSASQPMIALPRHYSQLQKNGSAPVVHHTHRKNRTKSPSPTHFSADKFSISQDSGINHQTSSSGSESSDYYTPPAEPYLPTQQPPTLNPHDDHSDRSDTPQPPPIQTQPPRQPRERFINIEDNDSTSDFDEPEKKPNDDSDETDFVRSLVYQKLQDEHFDVDPPFREKIAEKRLSKSHADLSEVKKFTRKTISSAPLVKHLKELENTFDEESNTSDVKSLSQIDLPESVNQSQVDLRSLSSNNLNDSQVNLQYPEVQDEPEKPVVKYPDFVRKKSLPSRPKLPEMKRRPSNIPMKVPFPKPKEGLGEVMAQLENPEWEQSVKGLQGLVKLVRNQQDVVEGQLHSVCVLLGRHIKNLRSQVARAACLAAGEMFQTHKKALEPELEELTVPLLQRTADTNKFLRGDANGALDQMCLNMTASRSVSVLTARGASHHNAVVRCATARLFSELVQRLGSTRIYQLPREIRDKILAVGANMLMEGSLETRKHAKNMFLELSSQQQFQRSLSEAITPTTLRNISKQLNNLK